MKKIKILLIIITLVIGINVVDVNAQNIKINSEVGILYNLNDDKVLYEKNSDKKVSIASLTKMMTALVVIENVNDLNKEVTFKKSDYDKLIEMDASGSSLDKDKTYTYYDLLYGLILESGADCANALARLTSGSEEEFVRRMNAKASELGMNNTSFENPIGMDDKNNYSTMEDLVILFKEGLKNNTFKEIITTFEYRLSDDTDIKHTIIYYLKNTDVTMDYLKGGKTGYEIDAGYALASIAEKDGVTLMFISSKADESPEQFRDAKKVYDYYFKNYSYQTVISKDEIITTLNTKYLSKDVINISLGKDVTYYLKNDFKKEDITLDYEGIETITNKNKYGETIGKIKIHYKNDYIDTIPVILNQEIRPDYKLVIVAGCVYAIIISSTIVIFKKIRRKKNDR